MKTVSLSIANYCVSCHAHCRYCLLSSCGQVSGAEYRQSTRFAHRVISELAETRPGFPCSFYIGYCMDTPDLLDYIRFSKEHRSPAAGFLQMNGFAFREEQELRPLMHRIREAGTELIDLTFYGTEEYHDRFAGRKGDFRFTVRMLDAAIREGLPVNVSIPILRENLNQLDELGSFPASYAVAKTSYFLPHSKGRGKAVQDQRITRQEFEHLPETIRNAFRKNPHRTEAEWLEAGEWEQPEKRNLTLVLTKDNLSYFESMHAEEIVSCLEALDDDYLSRLPSIPELAERYGNPENQQLFRFRDLLLKWQQHYIADTGNTIYDMHDETHHFSVHMGG
ncbi:MAG: radical SAM protein [Clostridia bacterium]|nr:radical SAM protein [Clostridia bacterium]